MDSSSGCACTAIRRRSCLYGKLLANSHPASQPETTLNCYK
jgi:hypothetical protein